MKIAKVIIEYENGEQSEYLVNTPAGCKRVFNMITDLLYALKQQVYCPQIKGEPITCDKCKREWACDLTRYKKTV